MSYRFFGKSLMVFLLFSSGTVDADGIRDHTQIDDNAGLTATQEEELTLVVVKTERQALQTWIRAAAVLDTTKEKLTAKVCTADARFIKAGQRVRAFPPALKSSITQSRVSSVSAYDGCVNVVALVPVKAFGNDQYYVMEVIIHRGDYLSIPNEAIIEEADHQRVYVQLHAGHYLPKIIKTGIKGELYTQVVEGLQQGDEVVTFGSFFIDADYKLKQAMQAGMGNAHHHH